MPRLRETCNGSIVQLISFLWTWYCWFLVSYVASVRLLPGRVRGGLRLATVGLGAFALCAMMVQSLGLLGRLSSTSYLSIATLGWALATLLSRDKPNLGLRGLVRRVCELWFRYPSPCSGTLAIACIGFLAHHHFAYVRGIDSLTIHGPLLTSWVRTGTVTLSSHWNYPQIWECQFVPNFLFLRSDSLVALPATSLILVLLLLVRELGSCLRLPGNAAWAASLLTIGSPVVWGGTLKNDALFAAGLLVAFIAIIRETRLSEGGTYLLLLGSFSILGAKPSGFVYVGLLVAAFSLLRGLHLLLGRRRPSRAGVAWVSLASLPLILSPAGVQIRNLFENGNPAYPIRIEIGALTLFPGPNSLAGTSILDSAGNWETWETWVRGSVFQLGADLPALLICPLLLIGIHFSDGLRSSGRGWRPSALSVFSVVVLVLWLLYLSTPWSRGNLKDPTEYIRFGGSLRYAIAAISGSIIASLALLIRLAGREKAARIIPSTLAAAIVVKWGFRRNWDSPFPIVVWEWLATAAVIALVAVALRHAWRRSESWVPANRFLARSVLLLSGCWLSLTFYSARVEAQRPLRWEPRNTEFWTTARKTIPNGSLIGTNAKEPLFSYFLLGPRFGNYLEMFPPDRIEEDLSYYYYLGNPKAEATKEDLRGLKQGGWRVLATTSGGRTFLLARKGEDGARR